MNKNPPSEQRIVRILTFFLPTKHWLRLLANDLLDGNIPEVYDLQQLMKTVNEKGRFNPRPAIAAWVLGELQLSEVQKSEATIALTLNIPADTVIYRLWKKLYFRIMVTYIVFIGAPFILIHQYIHQIFSEIYNLTQYNIPLHTIVLSLRLLSIGMSFVFFGGTIIFAFFNNLRLKYSLQSILKMERPEGIGTIARFWLALLVGDNPFYDYRKNSIYEWFIKRSASKIEPQHLGQLGPQSTPRLCGILKRVNNDKNPDSDALIFSILNILRLAGDEKAFPTLWWLTRSGKSQDVKSAAAEVLPAIRERAVSVRSAVTPDTLLRPVLPEPEGRTLYENQEEAQTLENRAQS